MTATAGIIWVASMVICFGMAKNKNRDPWMWTFWALLFGIFAVFFIVFKRSLPSKGQNL